MDTQNAQPRARRKHRSLAQELVAELSQRIRDGLIKRGEKLPTESAIMEEQGVSRTVVREALSRLQAAGLVETRHGIGTFVLDTPSASGFRIDPATRKQRSISDERTMQLAERELLVARGPLPRGAHAPARCRDRMPSRRT